mmetsp:Transcript_7064/g.11377  ORF Transcript_7064/g.11377 Transcript_7064/m.11377 type:complete len:88 (+) Transcript_7064:40-303(+)
MAKAVVKAFDMDQDTLEFAINQTSYALDNFTSEKEIASYLKQQFEAKYQPNWHCLVGRHFASYVTHEKSCYCYFYIGQMGVMLFKTP